MQYVSALALASLSGKAPTKESVTAILKATGKPVDDAQVAAVIESLKGRTVSDVISKGISKVGNLGAASAAPAAAKVDKKEDKKPEKKKEEKPAPPPPAEEEEADFGIDLFG